MPMALSLLSYDTITASETRLEVEEYTSLREAQLVAGYRSLLKLSTKDAESLGPARGDVVCETVARLMPIDRLLPRTKLGGIGLANFAGFLSRDWRTNDWWWGRMDASAGVLRFLHSLSPAPTSEPTRRR